jgi:hypothetical protein
VGILDSSPSCTQRNHPVFDSSNREKRDSSIVRGTTNATWRTRSRQGSGTPGSFSCSGRCTARMQSSSIQDEHAANEKEFAVSQQMCSKTAAFSGKVVQHFFILEIIIGARSTLRALFSCFALLRPDMPNSVQDRCASVSTSEPFPLRYTVLTNERRV